MGSPSAQKVLCVLYDDPVEGFPPNYARDTIPTLTHYPDGQTLPTPASVDFNPGHLLGSSQAVLVWKSSSPDGGTNL